jgi:hypothetical protein
LDTNVDVAETFMLVEGELVGERVVDIAAHPEVDTTFQLGHTLFLTESGKVFCTGCNTTGALALDGDLPLVLPAHVTASGFDTRIATHIAVSQRSSIIITDNDRLWLCGMTLEEGEDSFRIAQPTDIGWEHEAIQTIACGNSHCVILTRTLIIIYLFTFCKDPVRFSVLDRIVKDNVVFQSIIKYITHVKYSILFNQNIRNINL